MFYTFIGFEDRGDYAKLDVQTGLFLSKKLIEERAEKVGRYVEVVACTPPIKTQTDLDKEFAIMLAKREALKNHKQAWLDDTGTEVHFDRDVLNSDETKKEFFRPILAAVTNM